MQPPPNNGIKKQRKGCGLVTWIAFAVIALSLVIALVSLSSGDGRKDVNIVIKQNGQRHLYSQLTVNDELEFKETPIILSPIALIKIRGQLYVEPKDVRVVARILSKNFELLNSNDHLIDGYAQPKTTYEFMERTTITENADEIGKQTSIQKILLFRPDGNEFIIKWSDAQKPRAIKHCKVSRVSTVSRDKFDGTFLQNWPKTVLVSLDEINKFYSDTTKLEYDKKLKLLHIILD